MRASSDRSSSGLRADAVPAQRGHVDSESPEIEISAFVRERGQTLAILRNAGVALSSEEAIGFEARERVSFLAARWEGETLHVLADDSLPPLRLPADITTIIVNDVPAQFERRDGWIYITN